MGIIHYTRQGILSFLKFGIVFLSGAIEDRMCIVVIIVIMQGFGSFSGFIAAAFVAYLTLHKHLNTSMTGHQVFRKTLVELCKNIYSFSSSLSSSPSSLFSFHFVSHVAAGSCRIGFIHFLAW